MTTHSNFSEIAEQMLGDYDAHTPGTTFANGFRLSISDAYRLQAEVARLRQRRGERLTGYKIGCVYPGNQKKHGLTHPVHGRLWSTEQHVSNVSLTIDTFANLAIEGEIAISLRHDVITKHPTIQDIAEAVDEVFTVIELHNLVLHGDDPTGAELIANNAIHAGVVYSVGVRPPTTGDYIDLSVALNERTVGHWRNRQWPDDVLAAIPWLVSELAKDGHQLKAGQKILTGAWGPPLPVEQPQSRATLTHQTGKKVPHVITRSSDKTIANRASAVSTLFGSVTASFTTR
tara:strand:+ start:1025 stop:1888 length:864 start_codon:yes stop_codon:yes gene_type:complete